MVTTQEMLHGQRSIANPVGLWRDAGTHPGQTYTDCVFKDDQSLVSGSCSPETAAQREMKSVKREGMVQAGGGDG